MRKAMLVLFLSGIMLAPDSLSAGAKEQCCLSRKCECRQSECCQEKQCACKAGCCKGGECDCRPGCDCLKS